MVWNPFRKSARPVVTPVTRRPADVPVVNGIIDPPATRTEDAAQPVTGRQASAAPVAEPGVREAHTPEASIETPQAPATLAQQHGATQASDRSRKLKAERPTELSAAAIMAARDQHDDAHDHGRRDAEHSRPHDAHSAAAIMAGLAASAEGLQPAAAPLRPDFAASVDQAALALRGLEPEPERPIARDVVPEPTPERLVTPEIDAASAQSETEGHDQRDLEPAARPVQKWAEQERLERERQARREARLAALSGPSSDETPDEAARSASKPVTERFWGSLGLFVLRAVTAGTLFVHGLNGVIDNVPLQTQWGNTVVPGSRFVAMGIPWLELGAALLLFFGLLTRFAGLITALVMVATLVFVLWGGWSIFEPGNPGFLGEHELLLAAVGLALMLVGAGAWSLDYLTKRARTS